MLKELYKDKKEIENLPVPIREFLDNPETLKKINDASVFFKLDEEMEIKLKDIILELAGGKIRLYDLSSALADELEIEFEEATNISDKLYADLFIAIEDGLNAEYAVYQKTIPAEIPIVRESDVRKAQEAKSEFLPLIEKAVKKFGLFDPVILSEREGFRDSSVASLPQNDKESEELRKKFFEIADTFLSGVRTKAQFKNTMIKDTASGGLGMARQLADDVAEFLASYMRIGEIEKKKEKSSGVILRAKPEGSRDSSPSAQNDTKIIPPNTRIEVNFEKEEKEAAGEKSKIEKMKKESPKLLSVTEGVQKALAELNYTFPSSELQERLKSIIDARVRNVRTSIQTFDKLTQDIPSGGMGFTKAEADKVSLILNKYLEEKNKDIYGSKLAEIKQAEDEEKKKNEERTRTAEEAERKNFDERFTKLTGKTPPPVETREVPPALTKKAEPRSEASASTTGEIAEKKEEKIIPPLTPVVERSSLQGNAPPLITRGENKKLPPSEKGDKGGFTNPPQPSFSKGGGGPPRPVLEDIKYTPKLAGPTEEIARLTLEDFRRLSGDPKEAVLKIKDKLALLREESYKKYQTGIDAWYRSPLYGEYLKAMSQSLTAGVSLGEVLRGGQTLTQDEFDAIINNRVD